MLTKFQKTTTTRPINQHRDDSNLSKPKRSVKNSIKKQINTNDNKVLENQHDTTPTPTPNTNTDTEHQYRHRTPIPTQHHDEIVVSSIYIFLIPCGIKFLKDIKADFLCVREF